MNETYIFTDGGAKRNGKPLCIAAWGVYFGEDDPRNETGKITTNPSNQKAELYAIRMALHKISSYRGDQATKLGTFIIVTDSLYAINCLTKWCVNWKTNGWITSKKEPISHSELIQECCKLIKEIEDKGNKLCFTHIKSHCLAPKDKDSLQYFLWHGNYTVDKMVTSQMSAGGSDKINGKIVYIDWEGRVTEQKRSVKKPKGDGCITVNW